MPAIRGSLCLCQRTPHDCRSINHTIMDTGQCQTVYHTDRDSDRARAVPGPSTVESLEVSSQSCPGGEPAEGAPPLRLEGPSAAACVPSSAHPPSVSMFVPRLREFERWVVVVVSPDVAPSAALAPSAPWNPRLVSSRGILAALPLAAPRALPLFKLSRSRVTRVRGIIRERPPSGVISRGKHGA